MARASCIAVLAPVLGLALIQCVPADAAPRAARRPRHPAAPSPTTAAPVPAAKLLSLQVLPKEVTLAGPGARQLLVVTGVCSDGTTRDLSTQAVYAGTQPRCAAVSPAGLVTPVGDGSAIVRVSIGKTTAQVPVKVTGSKAPAQVSFTRDIVPILTQAGCNALSCHGSPAGKAGFKLSMFGCDPPADHVAITRQERTVAEKGRRIYPADPEKSVVLLKPTMQVPHQGGMRFKKDSPEYRTLLAWLRAETPMDGFDVPVTVDRLELLPPERVFAHPGDEQRLVVMAHYSDGTAEDVTHKAIYSSNDDSVAGVDSGQVKAAGMGETVVLARYLGRVGLARFLVPQQEEVAARDYAGFKPQGYVDTLALAKWKQMRFVPSDLATDTEFLRRVSLDLTGTLPTPDEIRAFLKDSSRDKRARKIDELLAKPEYADWWTVFWGDNLRNNGRLLQPNGARAYYTWIRQSVAENKPYDQFVRELITASGETFTQGPANFYRVANTPADRAEQVAQLFLGVRLQCAQCHNHPFEKWTRTNYHQFAAFFARVQARNMGNQGTAVTVLPSGEYRSPENNQVTAPGVLADQPVEVPDDKDPREVLATWLTSPENPLFARNLANRLWGQLFGRGIVDPVDDVRATNPPVNEPLLDALAKDLVAHRFDVRYLLRTIANSRTYQLSVRAGRLNEKDTQNFSRAYYRRLKAEALLDAVCQATGVPENYGRDYPAGTRAIQLVDNRVGSYFLDVFGRPRREVVCSCEREETANLTQALHLINGPINQKLGSPSGRVAEWEKSGKGDREIVEELYLWTVSRPPTPAENERALKQISAAGTRKREALEDLMWVLLNSREFLFNH